MSAGATLGRLGDAAGGWLVAGAGGCLAVACAPSGRHERGDLDCEPRPHLHAQHMHVIAPHDRSCHGLCHGRSTPHPLPTPPHPPGVRPRWARGHGAAPARAVAATSRRAMHDATRRAPRALTLTLTLTVTVTRTLTLTLTPNRKPHTPSAIACAMPKRGTLRAHSGLKCPSRQILPPRYLVRLRLRLRLSLRLSGQAQAQAQAEGSG